MYPSSIPPYNLFRTPTPDSVDVGVRSVFIVDCPHELLPLVFGPLSLLGDVNAWDDNEGLTAQNMVDIYNNEVRFYMSICDAVAECIRTNEGVRDEIRELIDGPYSGEPPGSIEAQSAVNDLDCVYGGAVALVDYLFDELDRICDILSAAGSIAEGVADYLKPAGVTIFANVLLELFGFIASAGTVVVQTSLSVANRDRLACDLFCQIVALGGVDYLVTNETLTTWVSNLDDSVLPDGVIQFALEGIVLVANEPPIPAIDPYTLINYYVLGSNECSDDWLTLCGCTTWEYTYDFLTAPCGMTPKTTEATTQMVWESGRGWKSGQYANVLEKARIADITSASWNTNAVVTGWTVEIEIDSGGAATGNAFNSPFAAPKTAINTTVDALDRDAWEDLDGIVEIEHEISPTSVGRTGYRLLVSSRNFNTSEPSGYAYIRRLTVRGTGNPPDIEI